MRLIVRKLGMAMAAMVTMTMMSGCADLEHLSVGGDGFAIDVDADDKCDILEWPAPDRPVREPAQAKGGIPLAVELDVIESIRDAVFEKVDEEEAVAEGPARCMLERQDVRGVLRPVKGVGEYAVLIVELHLSRRPSRCTSKHRQGENPAPERTKLGDLRHIHVFPAR